MADSDVSAPAAAAAGSPKKAKALTKTGEVAKKRGPKPKGDKKMAPHPPTASLVNEAIGKLNEKKGSSLRAIKKYIADVHKLDANRLGPFIRKYLRNGVAKGVLVQTKGQGAIGSFKLAKKGASASSETGEKRSRGRPKGSGSATKVKKAGRPSQKANSPKKIAASIKKSADKIKAAKPSTPKAKPAKAGKRGRPPGSTKKPAKAPKVVKSPKKAGAKSVGRPKGSTKKAASPKK